MTLELPKFSVNWTRSEWLMENIFLSHTVQDTSSLDISMGYVELPSGDWTLQGQPLYNLLTF